MGDLICEWCAKPLPADEALAQDGHWFCDEGHAFQYFESGPDRRSCC